MCALRRIVHFTYSGMQVNTFQEYVRKLDHSEKIK